MKKKSNKLSKLEKSRTSIFTNNLDTCIICGKRKEHLHEVFEGRNRQNSMKYGFVLPLCSKCHSQMHLDRTFSLIWKRRGQLYYEQQIDTREQFIKVFGRSYL